MDARAIEDAAALLVEARGRNRPLRELPAALAPRTTAHACAIQDAVARRLGGVAGWKVGARSPAAEPSCAPIPASLLLRAPHRFYAAQLRLRGVEAEFAFRIGRDLPQREEPYTAADMKAAVDSVFGAIELVESRFEDFRSADPLAVLADGNSHGALVIGSGREPDATLDPRTLAARVRFDGETVTATVGGNPAGDVWRLLAWLANHCGERCGGLRRGQIVTTGSCTGMTFAAPGTRVTAELADLRPVEILV